MLSIKEIKERTKVDRPILVKILDWPADYITWLFLLTPITPNAVTLLRIILQMLVCGIFFKGTIEALILGTLLYQSLMILDSVDGKLARVKQKFSLNGLLMDRIGHYLGNTIFLFMYSWCLIIMNYDKTIFYPLLGFGIIILLLLEKSVRLNTLWFKKEDRHIIEGFFDNKKLTDSSTHNSSWTKEIAPFIKIEYPFSIFFFGTIFTRPQLTLTFYFILYILYLVRSIIKPIRLISKYEKE